MLYQAFDTTKRRRRVKHVTKTRDINRRLFRASHNNRQHATELAIRLSLRHLVAAIIWQARIMNNLDMLMAFEMLRHCHRIPAAFLDSQKQRPHPTDQHIGIKGM